MAHKLIKGVGTQILELKLKKTAFIAKTTYDNVMYLLDRNFP